ncbi:bifunctional DNA primase/polymerase [Nocardia sp. NPDC050793]|uniref:bifunctional DNA primase/polymerase n=1 Tax=Nocardia sp. NPDC050793 TaxID=3155159 RepID=UPI0033F0F2F7
MHQRSEQARYWPNFLPQITSSGMHLHYRAPSKPPLRNTIERLGWRIDSRGEGGYVVAAGSHLDHGTYQLLDDREPITLPHWLIPLLTPPPPPPAPSAAAVSIAHPDAYVHAALLNQANRIRTARTGTRHRAVLLAANSLGRLVGAGLLDHEHAHTVLFEASRIHVGVDDFTEAEAVRTITDGLTYAAARTAPAGSWSLVRPPWRRAH